MMKPSQSLLLSSSLLGRNVAMDLRKEQRDAGSRGSQHQREEIWTRSDPRWRSDQHAHPALHCLPSPPQVAFLQMAEAHPGTGGLGSAQDGKEPREEAGPHPQWALGSLNRNSQSDDLFWILLHEGWKGLVWGQRTPLPHRTPSSGIFQLVCAAGANPSPRPPAFACAAPLTQAATSPNTVDACHIPLPRWCPCPPLITGPDLPLVNHPRSHEAQLGPGLSFVSPPGLRHESFQVFLKQKTKNEPWLV
ncbi:uncharacterized protein LOC119060522 [Artibeus jamaicensis]|uniref:uncharacterized protein LOC119060522 n=1 Tax=Artibeus jamaicensis TaxID=9417 RepID=UPI00235B0938|nr:uncharacterized protein LOC119060522 [Artibeus jamaicensis]